MDTPTNQELITGRLEVEAMSAHGLRVLFGDEAPRPPRVEVTSDTGGMTVEEYFHGQRSGGGDQGAGKPLSSRRFKGPYCRAARKRGTLERTLKDEGVRVRRWWEFCEYRMDHPVLASVSHDDLEAFQDWLLRLLGSPSNVNKHLDTITRILRHAAKRAKEIQVPEVDSVPAGRGGLSWVWPIEQVGLLYQAASKVDWPRNYAGGAPLFCTAPDLVRCFLMLEWNYGFRVGDVWPTKPHHEPLCWRHVRWSPRLEMDDGTVYVNQWSGVRGQESGECGWIVYEPLKTGNQDEPPLLVLPMNPTVKIHLRTIEPPGGGQPDHPVLNVPRVTNRKLAGGRSVGFYPLWWDLVAWAGIDPRTATVNGKIKRLTHNPESFRHTANTNHTNTAGVDGEKGVPIGNFITHGSARDKSTGMRHYYFPIPRMIESVWQLEQPNLSGRRQAGGSERQLVLF